MAVGLGVALALVVALPIVLTDSDESFVADEGSQRFPEPNFVKFDNLWDGTLSRKTIGNAFSKIDGFEDYYICTSSEEDSKGQIMKTPFINYQDGGAVCFVAGVSELIAGKEFVDWYSANNLQSYRMSPDEKFILARKNYMKQWRHSFYSDYYVFDLTTNTEVTDADILNHKQAQYAAWSPSGHKLIWVSNNKDIYYQTGSNGFASSTTKRVTDDGGWCIDEPHILEIEYPGTSGKCMYNGVPEWNYEEEMVGTTNTIYWAPDSSTFVFVSFDVSEIPLLEYSVYPSTVAAASPEESDKNSFEQYPRINSIKYAKALGEIAKTKMFIVTAGETMTKTELNQVSGTSSLSFNIGVGKDDNQENRYFTRIAWARDSTWFAMTWTSRAGTQAKTMVCKVDASTTVCEQNGQEDGGISGQWESDGSWTNIEAGNNYGGWLGSFGPFDPILTKTYPNFFNVYSYKVEDSIGGELHPYGIEIQDGFWNVAIQRAGGTEHLKGASWLTDSREGRWAVTGMNFYDEKNDFLYFTAARSVDVGSDEKTEQRKRHVFRVQSQVSGPQKEPECITCQLDMPNNAAFGHCGTVSIRRNCEECDKMFFLASCGGNDIPETYRTRADQDFSKAGEIEWRLLESNKDLGSRVKDLDYISTTYGVWFNEKYGTYHNYEMYTPVKFDTSGTTKYAVFLEVYAGPEFQKISSSFKTGWPQVHLPAAYDCITLSVDGRGSAFQGDKFMFSNYKALGQTERVDQTDFVRWFNTKGPVANVVDKTRVSVYGWSYGGYTTTHMIGYGGGEEGPVFTSGVAVAPLADWRYYDAMYAERYMDYTGDDDELTQMSWVNASMIERPINENEMEKFREAEYNLIHGTNDDNVHFISAAQMEKALVGRGIDFDNFFYADEDHSIRSTQLVQKHIYRNIITRIIKSWGYVWNGDGHGCGTCYNKQRPTRKEEIVETDFILEDNFPK